MGRNEALGVHWSCSSADWVGFVGITALHAMYACILFGAWQVFLGHCLALR